MERAPRRNTPVVVESYLDGAGFPCSREDIVILAEDNHAPESVLDMLEMLPDKMYISVNEVVYELARV